MENQGGPGVDAPTPPGDPVYHCPFCDGVLTLKIDGGKFMACEDDHCPLGHLDLRLSRLQAVQPSPPRRWYCASCRAWVPTIFTKGDMVCACGYIVASYFEGEPESLPKEGA